MKFYRIDWTDTANFQRIAWAGSEKEVERRVKAVKLEAVDEPCVMSVDFPTDKVQLLAWLNDNVNERLP